MRVRHLKSSGIVVEDDGVKVVCDPWLLDGAFYGSWAHYPPVEIEPEDLDDADYIYISHIHPDHFHQETLERMDKDIPVLIHDYKWDFLQHNIERLGFEVRELPHNGRTHLKGDLHINVLASDNCDPEACGSYFGCGWFMESAEVQPTTDGGMVVRTEGSTQIDSMGVFDNGERTVVNANDCRWPMSERAAWAIRQQYGEIDLLLTQYSAANFYPQCMQDYTDEERRKAAAEVILEMYGDAESFIDVLEPRYYMPFAGSYTLAGTLADYNEYLAVPERAEALEYFEQCDALAEAGGECVVLNSGEHLDLETGEASAEYEPIDPHEKQRYIEEELADRSYDFEDDPVPSLAEFEELVPQAFERFTQKLDEIGVESETVVLIELVDDTFARVPLDGGELSYVSREAADAEERYVKLCIDPRLLMRILRGPRYAHYNNAQIGSHVGIEKEPDIYERPLYWAMSFFHA